MVSCLKLYIQVTRPIRRDKTRASTLHPHPRAGGVIPSAHVYVPVAVVTLLRLCRPPRPGCFSPMDRGHRRRRTRGFAHPTCDQGTQHRQAQLMVRWSRARDKTALQSREPAGAPETILKLAHSRTYSEKAQMRQKHMFLDGATGARN